MEEERGPGSHDHSGYLDRSPPDDPHLCVCTGCVTCLWTSPFFLFNSNHTGFLALQPVALSATGSLHKKPDCLEHYPLTV